MQTLVSLRNAIIGHDSPKRLEFLALILDLLWNLFFGYAPTSTSWSSGGCGCANM